MLLDGKRGINAMARTIGKVIGTLLVIAMAASWSVAAETQHSVRMTADGADPMYRGKPLSYWVRSIQQRDSALMEMAFEAIRTLGPDAKLAVPELTRILEEPFAPIEIGVDDQSVILSKSRNIFLRADAVDALAAIGNAAAGAVDPVIRWGLTVRVILHDLNDPAEERLFIDLITIDVFERMRVAGAIAQFGARAAAPVAELLRSSDDEKRKLGVAILSEGALPIVSDYLKSANCDDRKLGIALLVDMWPVVAREHIVALKNAFTCESAD